MTTILAVSVGDRIEQYGAYAGFAAVLGLAVLALLYFAQAREVKRLREWAGRAPERAAEQEARVASDAQQRVVATPVTPPAPAAQPASAAATPAGAAPKAPSPTAPATAAASTQIIKPGAPPAAGSPAAASASAAEKPAQPGAADAAKDAPAPKPGEVPAAPSPAVPAAAATPKPPPIPSPPGPKVTPKPQPAAPLRVSQSTTTVPPRPAPRPPAKEEGGKRQILAIVGATAVVLAALVFVAIQVLGGEDTPAKPNTIAGETAPVETTPADPATTTPKASAVDRGQVTVAVLNGTTVPGLARAVADKLVASKFTELGTVTNAADQTRSATIVEFVSGQRDQALEVAKVIKTGADTVQPMSEATRVIAGQGAEVVVTVGSDQNPGQ